MTEQLKIRVYINSTPSITVEGIKLLETEDELIITHRNGNLFMIYWDSILMIEQLPDEAEANPLILP
jgi:hypothetical protein